ncbi:MAG TPA: tail fiber protein [Puia sp.]|jgi:microcystin-dependent protein|nr:tail fiber protein [Puia sp.]
MSDQYVGEIRIFSSNAIPAGWEVCDGKILLIPENSALFALLGTAYGGNGETDFALPDLRGAAALGAGSGAGLTPYLRGDKGGQATVTLNPDQMTVHTHAPAANQAGTTGLPSGAVWSTPAGRPPPNVYATAIPKSILMSPQAIGATGGGQPHNNLMPYTAFVFCIALDGEIPPRS